MTLTLSALNQLPASEFLARCGHLVEHSPWVAEALAKRRPFASTAAFDQALSEVVRSAGKDAWQRILCAHPELSGKEANDGTLTAASSGEQARLGLQALSPEHYALIQYLNRSYRDKFGFPFVICVRELADLPALFAAMTRRLGVSPAEEMAQGIDEVIAIACLRRADVVIDDENPEPRGLSTHVLDTLHGRPAKGVVIQLFYLGPKGASRRLVTTATTNQDGRAVMQQGVLTTGQYQLEFALGDYFAPLLKKEGEAIAGFLNLVPVRFCISDGDAHYHIPLVASPYAYSSYKGGAPKKH